MGREIVHVVATTAMAGTERYVATLAAAQAALGNSVTVVGGDEASMANLGALFRHVAYTGPAAACRALRSKRKADVVHAHLTTAEFLATSCFSLRPRTIVVSTRHIAKRRGSTRPARAASAFIRLRIDGQIAPSRYLAERVEGPCCVIPTGVADADIAERREPVVLVAQRLEREKDTATAIRAWASSGLADDGWTLQIAGDGTERSSLERLADELGVQASCQFLGHLPDVTAQLSTASIVLCPAVADSFGLTAVEAMARGVAVIAAAAGGHLETVGAVDPGMMFPPSDHSTAAVLLRKLADDAGRRMRHGVALREFQRAHLTLDSFASAVDEFYAATVRARGERPVR